MNAKRLLFVACVSALTIGGATAWAGTGSHGSAAKKEMLVGYDFATLPAGTHLRASLDQNLSTHASRPGDRFTATVTAPVRDPSGRVAIPAGAKLLGVVHVSTRGHGRYGASQIALGFDGVSSGGVTIPIAANVIGSERETWRAGVRARERSQMRAGARLNVQLRDDVRLADLMRTFSGYEIGGGPRK